MNLNTDSDSTSDYENGIEADDLSAIASEIVNKEYKTPFERRLVLGLMSRDYSLYDDVNKNPVDPADLKGYQSLLD